MHAYRFAYSILVCMGYPLVYESGHAVQYLLKEEKSVKSTGEITLGISKWVCLQKKCVKKTHHWGRWFFSDPIFITCSWLGGCCNSRRQKNLSKILQKRDKVNKLVEASAWGGKRDRQAAKLASEEWEPMMQNKLTFQPEEMKKPLQHFFLVDFLLPIQRGHQDKGFFSWGFSRWHRACWTMCVRL